MTRTCTVSSDSQIFSKDCLCVEARGLKVESTTQSSCNIINQFKIHIKNQSRNMVLEQRKLWLSLTAQSPVLEFLCPPQKHPASLVLPTSVPAFGDICPTLCWELPVMQAGVILEMRLPKTAWKTLSDVMFLLLLLLSTHLWKKK